MRAVSLFLSLHFILQGRVWLFEMKSCPHEQRPWRFITRCYNIPPQVLRLKHTYPYMWIFTHVFPCISPVLSQTGSLSPVFDSHKLVPKMKHANRSNASRSFWFVVLCRVVNPLIVPAGRPVDKTLSWLLTLQEPLISNLFFPLLAIFAFFNKHFQCFDQGHKILYML